MQQDCVLEQSVIVRVVPRGTDKHPIQQRALRSRSPAAGQKWTIQPEVRLASRGEMPAKTRRNLSANRHQRFLGHGGKMCELSQKLQPQSCSDMQASACGQLVCSRPANHARLSNNQGTTRPGCAGNARKYISNGAVSVDAKTVYRAWAWAVPRYLSICTRVPGQPSSVTKVLTRKLVASRIAVTLGPQPLAYRDAEKRASEPCAREVTVPAVYCGLRGSP